MKNSTMLCLDLTTMLHDTYSVVSVVFRESVKSTRLIFKVRTLGRAQIKLFPLSLQPAKAIRNLNNAQ